MSSHSMFCGLTFMILFTPPMHYFNYSTEETYADGVTHFYWSMDDIYHGGVVDGSTKGKVGPKSKTCIGKFQHAIEIANGEELYVGKLIILIRCR